MLKIYIRDRKKVYFDGEATSISSINDTGKFDVLAAHANFTSIIKEFLIVDKGLTTEQKVEIEQGVLNVKSDSVRVYVGLNVPAQSTS